MIRHPAIRLLSAGIGLVAGDATAQTKLGDAQMLAVTGKCEGLVIGERSFSGACGTKLLNVSYPNGRVGFYFVLGDGRIITFSGTDGENPTPDTDIIALDKVIMSRKDTPDQPDVFKAEGTCGFGNPMKGPMTVSCAGTLADGKTFSAAFTTDGKPPT